MIIIIILDFIQIIINTLSKGDEEYQSHVEGHHLYEDAQWQNILQYRVTPSYSDDSDSEMEVLRVKNLQIPPRRQRYPLFSVFPTTKCHFFGNFRTKSK